jgi:exodeoxyribonuclease-5
MHSAKGLEWPIVIPINSPTALDEHLQFLHRRSDDTVHFKLLGEAGPHYELVKTDERDQIRRERIRLWYVALTRACDLLLLPRQSERAPTDWLSLLDPRLEELPSFDGSGLSEDLPQGGEQPENEQDEVKWKEEAATIAATRRTITWRSPSRHESFPNQEPAPSEEEIYTDTTSLGETLPATSEPALPSGTIQGGRERGLVLHKLLEEILTGEATEEGGALESRATVLLAQLGVPVVDRPEDGPCAPEIAATAARALLIPEVAALRTRLLPEMTIFSAESTSTGTAYIGGVADALAVNPDGTIDVIIDWKSDVNPTENEISLYRRQVQDYLDATSGREGMLVFATSGKVLKIDGPISG